MGSCLGTDDQTSSDSFDKITVSTCLPIWVISFLHKTNFESDFVLNLTAIAFAIAG